MPRYRSSSVRILALGGVLTTLPGAGTVPLNVARICEWTWMCALAPVGPNIHANAVGYRVIADAFEQAIGSRRLAAAWPTG